MKNAKIIIEATDACDIERRGIGVQMRTWIQAMPFADFPHLQFIIATRKTPTSEPLSISGPNVLILSKEKSTEEEYIDYLYELDGNVLFFPLAAKKYIRDRSVKKVGIDYGMEDFYCRNYIKARPLADFMYEHEFAMQHYAGIITVSKTSQRDLQWFFPESKDKVSVIYPGSSKNVDDLDGALPDILRNATYFLIIGYERKKNIVRISKAFDVFKQETGSQTKLVIAGKPGYGAEEIDECINSLSSCNDIIRLGYIPEAQKQSIIKHCHAVVALPIYEGFGISALEGLLVNKIVLVSDNGSLKEVVGRAGYLASPFSIASIREQLKVIDILQSNPREQYVAQQTSQFDQSRQARKLIELLDKVSQGTD
jgi:glycosyltransferase involved in cell wall biosynthesis